MGFVGAQRPRPYLEESGIDGIEFALVADGIAAAVSLQIRYAPGIDELGPRIRIVANLVGHSIYEVWKENR